MEYIVIHKDSTGSFVLARPGCFTYEKAKEFAREINGLVIHKAFVDCLDLM